MQAEKLRDLQPCGLSPAGTNQQRHQKHECAKKRKRATGSSAREVALWRKRINILPRRSLLETQIGACVHERSIGRWKVLEKITPDNSMVTSQSSETVQRSGVPTQFNPKNKRTGTLSESRPSPSFLSCITTDD